MLDGTEAIGVQRVVDVAGEIGPDDLRRDRDPGRPLADEGVDVGESSVAAGDEVAGELRRRDAGQFESNGANGPDGGDPGEAGMVTPEGREVEPEERRGAEGGIDVGLDLIALLAREESRVADEERGVGGGKHGDSVRTVFCKGGAGVVEVLEEDVRVGGGTARGVVGGDSGDVGQRLLDWQVAGIFDEQEDAANLVKAGYGAAGDDGQLRRELGDGDQAEIGGAGVELTGAVSGRGVVELVAGAQSGGGGWVLKVEQEGRRIQEGDGGDAKGHKKILVGYGCGIAVRYDASTLRTLR